MLRRFSILGGILLLNLVLLPPALSCEVTLALLGKRIENGWFQALPKRPLSGDEQIEAYERVQRVDQLLDEFEGIVQRNHKKLGGLRRSWARKGAMNSNFVPRFGGHNILSLTIPRDVKNDKTDQTLARENDDKRFTEARINLSVYRNLARSLPLDQAIEKASEKQIRRALLKAHSEYELHESYYTDSRIADVRRLLNGGALVSEEPLMATAVAGE